MAASAAILSCITFHIVYEMAYIHRYTVALCVNDLSSRENWKTCVDKITLKFDMKFNGFVERNGSGGG